MAEVLPAAKEKSFQPHSGLHAWLAEKPHPGPQPNEPKPHWADHTLKFHIALGFRVCSYDFCSGPLSTGYYRDASTGLDYADQRYEQPGMGRFMTPDSAPSAKLGDPGSWNKYAYVGGDPINRVDPGGQDWWDLYSFLDYTHMGDLYQQEVEQDAYAFAMWWEAVDQFYSSTTSLLQPLQDQGLIDGYTADFWTGLSTVTLTANNYNGLAALGLIQIANPQTLENGMKVLTLAAATAAAIWEYFKNRVGRWDVTCHVHVIGTENHESDVTIKTSVNAADYETAYSLAQEACNGVAREAFGASGWHLQHVIVRRAFF